MLEFEMPKAAKEFHRHIRFCKALERETGDENPFWLNIEKGLLEVIEERMCFDGFKKEIIFGCEKTEPQIKYSCRNNGKRISYIRTLRLDVGNGNFYKNSIPIPEKIAEALSSLQNYSETFSLHVNGLSATLFSDRKGWSLYLKGCYTEGVDLETEGFNKKDAVSLALDFYNQKTFK